MTLQQTDENPRLPRPDSADDSSERPSGCLGFIAVVAGFLLVMAAIATVVMLITGAAS